MYELLIKLPLLSVYTNTCPSTFKTLRNNLLRTIYFEALEVWFSEVNHVNINLVLSIQVSTTRM